MSTPHASLAILALVGALATPARAVDWASPDFLMQAEKSHADAKAALAADQEAYERLLQEEAKLRQQAVAKSGSWIEPAALWRKKTALEKTLASEKQRERRTKSLLAKARDQARASAETEGARAHKPAWFGAWWRR